MTKKTRPLSPHLSIYKLPFSAKLSILHRFTGFVLFIGTLFLCWGITFASYFNQEFIVKLTSNFFYNSFFQILILGWSFSLFYHLCNGLRHLYWDMGYGLEIKQTYYSNWIVFITSCLMTVISWLIV